MTDEVEEDAESKETQSEMDEPTTIDLFTSFSYLNTS